LAGVGIFQSYYEFGPLKDYDSSTISWIPSLEIFFLFFLGPAVGFLFDKYGPTPLILVGTFLHVFGLMMASLATEYYQFLLAQGVCSAIGLSFLYSPGRFLPGPATSWSIP
jgi:MFS family permease